MSSGFRMNPSSWPSFLQKTLTGAVVAPDNCFKKVYKKSTLILLEGHIFHYKIEL